MWGRVSTVSTSSHNHVRLQFTQCRLVHLSIMSGYNSHDANMLSSPSCPILLKQDYLEIEDWYAGAAGRWRICSIDVNSRKQLSIHSSLNSIFVREVHIARTNDFSTPQPDQFQTTSKEYPTEGSSGIIGPSDTKFTEQHETKGSIGGQSPREEPKAYKSHEPYGSKNWSLPSPDPFEATVNETVSSVKDKTLSSSEVSYSSEVVDMMTRNISAEKPIEENETTRIYLKVLDDSSFHKQSRASNEGNDQRNSEQEDANIVSSTHEYDQDYELEQTWENFIFDHEHQKNHHLRSSMPSTVAFFSAVYEVHPGMSRY